MEIFEVICLVVIAFIICMFSSLYIGMKCWCAMVFSLIVGLAILLLLFPLSRLINEPMSGCVVAYLVYIVFVLVFVFVYCLFKSISSIC